MNDYPPIPPDDLQRHITLAQPDKDQDLPHIGSLDVRYWHLADLGVDAEHAVIGGSDVGVQWNPARIFTRTPYGLSQCLVR